VKARFSLIQIQEWYTTTVWYRSYAKQYLHPPGDYTYPIFKNELGERVCAGVDDRNLLCIYHCESEGDDDDSDASSQEDDGSTGTDGSDENSSWS
jgi:hypothetical protein